MMVLEYKQFECNLFHSQSVGFNVVLTFYYKWQLICIKLPWG